MTDTYELPPLPPIPYLPNSKEAEERILGEWAREYARLAVKQERERLTDVLQRAVDFVEAETNGRGPGSLHGDLLAAIRNRGTEPKPLDGVVIDQQGRHGFYRGPV